MMRDPRDQTISRLFHIRRDPTHAWHQRFQDMSNDQALMACIEGRADRLPGTIDMINMTRSWLYQEGKALCVKYESLKSNPEEELKRVLRYLKLEDDDSLIRAIVDRNRFERLSVGRKFWKVAREPGQEDIRSHVRKGVIGDWRNYFRETHIQCYKELAGDALIELGYEKDSNW
jgi:hypothetical protein